ncbi:hypothetical protein [Subtercola frigoramans]|uniref:Uncharacterized protein n=1 Tax=Subtercola frigoramans TaxID=120298 RepID=A0ABS2L051_9MICO|nr:hypothetical protein [Subtercola frigoramans]MBM7470458.1 hypothetical protein [Subtercola frigoramans]
MATLLRSSGARRNKRVPLTSRVAVLASRAQHAAGQISRLGRQPDARGPVGASQMSVSIPHSDFLRWVNIRLICRLALAKSDTDALG